MKREKILFEFCLILGIIFPIIAIITELQANNISLSFNNLIFIHKNNHTLYFVELAAIAILQITAILKVEYYRKREYFEKLNKVLNLSICSYVLINVDGNIEYTNKITREIYGSEKTIGKNILKFTTVAGTEFEKCIRKTMTGRYLELKMYKHISATTNDIRYLNITFVPFEEINKNEYKVLLITENKTKEKEYADKLEGNFINIINVFAKIMDAKDKYTSNHSSNVKRISQLILSEMNLPEDEKENIIKAAGIHDIGKIGIKDYILNKDGALTDDEYSIMKKHPEIGAEMLSGFDNFKEISDIILYHHERIDGKGYPIGIKNNEIPIGAQVVCIADSIDAMFSKRVYSEPFNIEHVRAELIINSGKQFNKEIINIIINNAKLLQEIADLTQKNIN